MLSILSLIAACGSRSVSLPAEETGFEGDAPWETPSADPDRQVEAHCTGVDFFPTELVHLGTAGGAVVWQYTGCAEAVRPDCPSWVAVDVAAELTEGDRVTLWLAEPIEEHTEGVCLFRSSSRHVEELRVAYP